MLVRERYVPNSRAVEARVRRWRKAPVKLVRTVGGRLVCVVRPVDDQMLIHIKEEERREAMEKAGRINKWTK